MSEEALRAARRIEDAVAYLNGAVGNVEQVARQLEYLFADGYGGNALKLIELLQEKPVSEPKPLDMLIFCPNCGKQHIDKPEPDICKCGHHRANHYTGEPVEDPHDTDEHCADCVMDGRYVNRCKGWQIAWNNPPHKSHTCRTDDGGCGLIFRIADVPTNGVATITTRGKDDTWPAYTEEKR